MSAVKISNVIKNYDAVQVIFGVDLEIEDGEFCVFVGPSGCGKSTLLRMVAGLEQTTGGQIMIGERDVTDAAPSDRGVAMVFQTYALYPHMTVEQNMGFGLKMNGVPKEEINIKVASAANTLQLGEYMQRKPKALSGGQRQRVAIGRAIVRGPEVFLFDEPLSNLDAELRVDMRVEISRLHKELNATIVYVTHDQVEAMTLADKIVVLRAGRVEQVGSPMKLYQDPDNKFVAGFIGSPGMNFIEGVIEGGKVRMAALDGMLIDARVVFPDGMEKVTVGLRPQDLSYTAAASQITIDITEQLGGVAYDYLLTPTGERLVVETKGTEVLPSGTSIIVNVNSETTYFFDADTEARIR